MENTKKKEDWSTIHPQFAQKAYHDKTFQKVWEAEGINYAEAKEWVRIGFQPAQWIDKVYSCSPAYWKNHGFTLQTTAEWLQAGLGRNYKLATYARWKGYQPNSINLTELKTEFENWKEQANAQEYLDLIYPTEVRKNFTELNLYRRNLTGNLTIDGTEWANLKVINCARNQLTSLELLSCEKLTSIKANENQLTKVAGLPVSLTELSLSNNQLTDDLTIFSHLINLENLWIGNNQFNSSLEHLKNLTKLKGLDIEHNLITSGLEYLPESLGQYFSCGNTALEKELNRFKIPFRNNDYLDLLNRWRTVNFLKVREARKPIIQTPLQLLESQLNLKEEEINLKEQLIKELKEQLELTAQDKLLLEKLNLEKLQLEKELKELKDRYNQLLSNDLTASLQAKEEELNKLKKKFQKEEYATDKLLEAVTYLSSYDVSTVREYHLQEKTSSSGYLLKKGFKKQDLEQICKLQEEITQIKLRLAEIKGKSKQMIEYTAQEKLLLEFTNFPQYTEQLKELVTNLLKIKQNFLNSRLETIQQLQTVCNTLENNLIIKFAIIEETGSTVAATGKLVEKLLPVKAVEATGDYLKVFGSVSQRVYKERKGKEFKFFLKEETELTELTQAYNSLLNTLKINPELTISKEVIKILNLEDQMLGREIRLFNSDYSLFEVITNIWPNKAHLVMEDMKLTIEKLVENLRKELRKELEEEEWAFSQLNKETEVQTLVIQSSNQFRY